MSKYLHVAGVGALAIGTVVGNYYYVIDDWKANHPIYKESIELMLRDPAIVKELGTNIKKGKVINGNFEIGKNWGNSTFEVEGYTSAKVTVVADGKSVSEAGNEEYPTAPYKDCEPTLVTIGNYINPEPTLLDELKWKIISLSVVIDDWVTVEVVNNTDKLHKDIIKKEKSQEVEFDVEKSVGAERRKKQINNVTYLYWKMLPAGIVTVALGIYISGFFKKRPVVNSVFFNKSLEVIRNSKACRDNIGMPVHSFNCLKGYLNYNGTSGQVWYFVHGPLGIGKVRAMGKFDKNKKEWELNELELEKDNKIFNIKN